MPFHQWTARLALAKAVTGAHRFYIRGTCFGSSAISRLKPLLKSLQRDEDRSMNTTTFPHDVYPHAEKSDKRLSVSAGIRYFTTYISRHEAAVLIVLAVLLIAGTVLYVDLQPRVSALSGPPPKIALAQSVEAPTQQPGSAELPSALAQEDSPDTPPNIATPLSRSAGLASSGKRNHQLVKRKGVRHHHRR